MNKYSRFLLILSLLATVCGLVTMPGKILAADRDISESITQNYQAESSVLTGMIVGFKDKSKTVIVPLESKKSRDMLGVVVPVSDVTFTLTKPGESSRQVLVATSGNHNVLVSSQNGPVKAGDYLTISAAAGVAMKANEFQAQIIGTATGDFSGKGNQVIGSLPLKNANGGTNKVSVGTVPVNLRLAPNPRYIQTNSLPGAVTKTATALANKPVTLIQIYISLAVLVLTFFTVGIMFYGAVRSSITSIGRNPLSKRSIVGGLIKVLVLGLLILAAGLFAAYLVIKI